MDHHQKEELALAVRKIQRHNSFEAMQDAFRERTMEAEFAEVGEIALADRALDQHRPHLVVWAGYEYACSSRYLAL